MKVKKAIYKKEEENQYKNKVEYIKYSHSSSTELSKLFLLYVLYFPEKYKERELLLKTFARYCTCIAKCLDACSHVQVRKSQIVDSVNCCGTLEKKVSTRSLDTVQILIVSFFTQFCTDAACYEILSLIS